MLDWLGSSSPWSCFSTCHRKDADPDVQVPPSNHCHFTAIPGALLLLMFGLPGRPDPRAQHDHVEHPYGDESRPVYRHPPYQWAQMMTESWYIPFQVKLLPKCNLGLFFFFFFFCECIRAKPLCKSIVTMKEALLGFFVLSFSAQTHFQRECTFSLASKSLFSKP